MALLEWKPEFSVGVKSVDDEHRELIDLINVVYGELHGQCDGESIACFLGDIHAGIAMHFALEERIMKEAGYDEFGVHKDDHEELLDQIRGMMDAIVEDPEEGLALLSKSLSDWFGVHFATHDARLHGRIGA